MRAQTLGWLSVLALCGLAVAGCGSSDDESDAAEGGRSEEEIVIGWTPPDTVGVFKTATEYFEKAADEANAAGFNVKVQMRAPETHTSYSNQIEIIENFISKNVDVIAVSPSDTEAIKPAIKQANQAGIPVILVNLLEEQTDVEIASYIGFDNSEAASVVAYSVLDYFGGPGVLGDGPKVEVEPGAYLDLKWWEDLYADADKNAPKASGGVIEGIAGTFFSQARLDGFREVIDQYPNIELLGEPIAADWNREKGVGAMEDLLSRFGPDEMNFVYSASTESGLGAMAVLERRGVITTSGGESPREDGKIAAFSQDVTPESTEAIRKGTLIAETTHGFAEWGWFGTQFGVMLACGEEVPEIQNIRPRTVYQGNVDEFYPEPQLPKVDWAKIKADC